MRFLSFFLVAALVTALNADDESTIGKRFKLPQGLPDGSIATFFFWHTGNEAEPESVQINFYDTFRIDLGIYEYYDVTAHLRIDRVTGNQLVVSNTKEHGKWLTEVWGDQPTDERRPPSNGYWRVDVIKHREFEMSIFFQGFWAGARKFEKSLNNLQTVYIISPHVDYNYAEMRLKLPNDKRNMIVTRVPDFLTGTVSVTFASFPNFPIGAHIEMTVLLRSTEKRSYGTFDVPRLIFVTHDGSEHIMKIHNLYFGLDPFARPHQLWIHSENKDWETSNTPCTDRGSNGDLQHLYIQRISQNVVRVQVFYKSNGASGITCDHTIRSELAEKLDKPFDIISHEGSVVLHLDHSIPGTIEKKSN